MVSVVCKALGCFLLYVVCFQTMTAVGQNSAQVSAEILLNAFCRLPDKIFVMQCVNQKTNGKALDPWNQCLNSRHELTKEEQINLSCKSLLPQYAVINGILTSCVDTMIDPADAAKWMPIMEQCGREAKSMKASGNSGNLVTTTTKP